MKVYNTMTGQKEGFAPQGDVVKMYVCGVTPYDNSHLGHAMSYVFFDVIRRYLKFRGFSVKYVQNVTDIDDKIIMRANQRGIPTNQLSGKFEASYFEDMKALNVVPADVNPRATEEIPEIIAVIRGLVEKGFAYRTPDGSVYFRVTKVPDYGKLSHRTLEGMQAGARIEVGEQKEHPMDFALWKASKQGEPSWDSPWGKGRPGWHIECTAMSLKYLGETLDIHGGGQDLIFPHHENEIAQSESYTGKKPFVRFWMHNGLVQVGEEKMSKSLGNLITIKDALVKHSSDALRIFVLSSHYRSPLSYSEEGLDAADKGADRLIRAANREDTSGKGDTIDALIYQRQFIDAMDDDFNTAQGLSVLFDLARAINQAADSGANIESARQTLKELAGNVMGLKLVSSQTRVVTTQTAEILSEAEVDQIITGLKSEINGSDVNKLVMQRATYRSMKNFKGADEIRTRLAELGILLEDTPRGTVWRVRK